MKSTLDQLIEIMIGRKSANQEINLELGLAITDISEPATLRS